jgi:hypothetical protein
VTGRASSTSTNANTSINDVPNDNEATMAGDVDQTFTGLTIHLDGSSFRDCTFDNCTIIYSGTSFVLERPAFKNCKLLLEGAAAATVAMLIDLKDECPELIQPYIEQISGSIVEADDHE